MWGRGQKSKVKTMKVMCECADVRMRLLIINAH